jgi:hypothetical protein
MDATAASRDMPLRHLLRRAGNALLSALPTALRRAVLKGFAEQPELAEECGFQVVPTVFYSPVPVPAEISRDRLGERRLLPGIDLRIAPALALCAELTQRFDAELAQIPRQRTTDGLLWLENDVYSGFDAATLYAMLRHLRPRRYIEIGCGYSTRASTLALTRNAAEGAKCDAHFVEPFPSEQFLELTLPGPFHRQRVQEMPPELFTALQAGDVLFIDTSHVLKTQSDVEHELLRIVPLLAPGVWVHLHDIFTPFDYPEEWVLSTPRAGNNEQYALECLLSGGDRFQVELPVYALWREHRKTLDPLCPGVKGRPAAFWIRRRE